MNKSWNKAITYGVLNDALLSLGFERYDNKPYPEPPPEERTAKNFDRLNKPYTGYTHPDYDAFIALPPRNPDEVVRPAHYVRVESELKWMVGVSEEDWYKLLMSKARVAKRTKQMAAVPAEAA